MNTRIRLSAIIFIAFFYAFSGKINAQNYEAIKNNAEHFFIDSINQDIIAIRIDSVKPIGDDIYFYNYRQIRQTDNSCYTIHGASWLGDQVIEKPDGMFIFDCYPFSPADSADIYRILTHAQINQVWSFYSYHTINQHIEAKVSDIILMQFLNQSDSVKIITLTRKDAAGLVIADPVNSQRILLSKNFGLIRLPKFDDFRYSNTFYDLAGKTNPETGITNITTLQIYDYEPGDEFHTVYYDRYFSIPYPETTISTIMKVLSKETSPDGKSVTYTFEQCQSSNYRLSDTNSTVTFRHDTITQTYSTQQTPEFETEPLEPAVTSNNGWVINTHMGISTDLLFPFPENPYKSIQSLEAYSLGWDDCYMPVMIDGCLTSIYYFKGLGGPYYKCGEISWGPSSNLLVYYKKADKTWGTPLNCDSLQQVGIVEYPCLNNVNYYPNPTIGLITFLLSESIKLPARLEISDISGRVAGKFNIGAYSQTIDLGNLESGLYTFTLRNSGHIIFRGKIIRQ